MKCQICNKNFATIHLTDVSNNLKELHLCEKCAKQKSVMSKALKSFDVILNLVGAKIDSKIDKYSKLKCPICGITYFEFKSKTRLGCSNDYKVFAQPIKVLVDKIHGCSRHVGKTPNAKSEIFHAFKKMRKLEKDMQIHINDENYERAAIIRDKIKVLKEKIDENK